MRKTVINTASHTGKMRKYFLQWELYTEYDTATITVSLERETLHIMDDKARIALIDTPITLPVVGEVQLLRYQYSNHLSTATLELDVSAAIISYKEYYPYGNTSFQCGRSGAEVSLKRYRYTGKERDEETGFNYHGARYYIPWLARWCADDPINSEWYNQIHGQPGRNLDRQFVELTASGYEYCYANPVRFTDLSGEQVPNPKAIFAQQHPVLAAGIDGTTASVSGFINFLSEGIWQQETWKNMGAFFGELAIASVNSKTPLPHKPTPILHSKVSEFNRDIVNGNAYSRTKYFTEFATSTALWYGAGKGVGAGLNSIAKGGAVSEFAIANRTLTSKNIEFYHGTNAAGASNIKMNGIDLSKGSLTADFGQGFYMTENATEAIKSAERIPSIGKGNAVLVTFSISEQELKSLNTLTFSSANATWDAFVRYNKEFPPLTEMSIEPSGSIYFNEISSIKGSYDMISGPMYGRINSKGNMLQNSNRMQTSIHSENAANLFNKNIQK